MKGLIIKDFFCLKKQLINYAFILVAVIVISILYVLSYNFGNIHAGVLEMAAEEQVSNDEIVQISSLALLLFMLIPIACTGDITNLFADDENASFYKVVSSLPVSVSQRVGCRFLTGYLYVAIGVMVDFVMTIILSSLTDIISFWDFCGVIISFASLMLMYISLLIMFMYLLGKGKTTYANMLPLLIGVFVYIAVNFKKIREVIIGSSAAAMSDLYSRTIGFIEKKSYILLIAAIVVSAGAYSSSVYIADKKRGVA